MNHKNGPYRQCVSCRRVFPKGELLRFVRGVTDGISFDERGTARGRGYYLCPEKVCFSGAWKNKKTRTLINGEAAGERLFESVHNGLLHAVKELMTAGIGITPEGFPGKLETGDLLLVRKEMGGRQLDNLLETAQAKGVHVFMVPRIVLNGEEAVAITKKSLKISPLLRNLRFYERLSSKGRAL